MRMPIRFATLLLVCLAFTAALCPSGFAADAGPA